MALIFLVELGKKCGSDVSKEKSPEEDSLERQEENK